MLQKDCAINQTYAARSTLSKNILDERTRFFRARNR